MSSKLKMSKEISKLDVNKATSFKNSSDVKEEYQDEFYQDKVYVSETTITNTINVSNSELIEYIKNDEIRKYETLSLNQIQTDLQLSEVNDLVSNNVEIEDGNCSGNTQIQFSIEQLFCNHCHEVYQDYCTKCRVLVHILNKNPSHNTYDSLRELPKFMLEAKESIGHLGIFSLKVIPEDVKFGPFTGLNSTVLPLRIKGGRFVVSDDKSKQLNWMQYVNPARNIYEQNLYPFQYEEKLYYCSTRRIQEGEELLVYFGKEYENNLLKNVEMDFVPITKKDVENVFACTFCCLGFSSKEYLAEHKAASHNETKEMFSVKELTQCQFCKMYLETKEYFDHHMDYCCETNDRYWVPRSPALQELKVERHSSERHKTKSWKRRMYKCMQCQFRTMYIADFRHHANKHCEVKLHKCGICHRRYKAKESLRSHVVKNHGDNEGRGIQKYNTCDNFKANTKNIKEGILHSHDDKRQCQKRKLQPKDKFHLKSLIKAKYLNRGKYKCAICEFKTYYRSNLQRHTRIKHLMEKKYKCSECEFKTSYKPCLVGHEKAKHLKATNYKCMQCEFIANRKSNLQNHIQAKHDKQNNYKCTECEYKTYYKSNLDKHIKSQHLKQYDYKCMECEYMTNRKSNLQVHIKGKHLKESDYKCAECEFKTNYKSCLQVHVNRRHLKQKDCKCTECDYVTSRMSDLNVHIKAKHLKQNDYKCAECEYKTNFKSYLKVHIKSKHLKEKDYKCTECEFKTCYKSSLETHIEAKHLKANDYKCRECEFKTNYRSHLKTHIKAKHLKENYYRCTECEFKTNYRSCLQVHIKRKHQKVNDFKMECE